MPMCAMIIGMSRKGRQYTYAVRNAQMMREDIPGTHGRGKDRKEMFASFLIYNFTQAAAWAADTSRGVSKYKRHVNFSDAVYACCAFLRDSFADPLPLLRRKLLPFRPGRASPRPKISGNRISSCYNSAR